MGGPRTGCTTDKKARTHNTCKADSPRATETYKKSPAHQSATQRTQLATMAHMNACYCCAVLCVDVSMISGFCGFPWLWMHMWGNVLCTCFSRQSQGMPGQSPITNKGLLLPCKCSRPLRRRHVVLLHRGIGQTTTGGFHLFVRRPWRHRRASTDRRASAEEFADGCAAQDLPGKADARRSKAQAEAMEEDEGEI